MFPSLKASVRASLYPRTLAHCRHVSILHACTPTFLIFFKPIALTATYNVLHVTSLPLQWYYPVAVRSLNAVQRLLYSSKKLQLLQIFHAIKLRDCTMILNRPSIGLQPRGKATKNIVGGREE